MPAENYPFPELGDELGKHNIDLVFVAPPGCGKGEQTKALEKAGLVLPVGMSGLLKAAASAKVIDPNQLADDMANGRFAPDAVVKKAVDFAFPVNHPGVLAIDGLPRTMGQVAVLDQIQQVRQRALVIVSLAAQSETLIARQMQRSGRPDAQFAAATRRLDDYNEETQPVADHLMRTHGGIEVHTGPTNVEIPEVSARLESALVQHLRQRFTRLVPGTLLVGQNSVAAQ